MSRLVIGCAFVVSLACSPPPTTGPTGGGSAGGFSTFGGGSSGVGGGSTGVGGGSTGVGGGSTGVGGGSGGSLGGGSSGGAAVGGGSSGGAAVGGGGTGGGAAGGMAMPGGVGTFVRVGFFNQRLATGPDGRMHLTFLEGAAERVFYGSCLQDCASDAAWSPVQLRDSASLNTLTVGSYGIGVDATNRVHLLVGAVVRAGQSANEMQYGTCASGCGVASNWTWLDLSTVLPGRGVIGTTRAFMVRPSGAVSFFSSDGTYFTCAGACSTLGNWSAPVALNFEVLQAVVDGAGVSHALLNKGRTANGEALLGYARCASGCSTPANWQSSALGFLTNAGLFTASLTATGSGRLFIAYNQGVITASTQDNQKLFVASCLGAGCLDLNTWTSFTTGVLDEGDSGAWVEASGEGVVLASNTVTELKVTACEVDCHLAASWSQAVVVDTSAAIAQAVNPAAGTTCPTTATFAAWYPKRPIIGIGPNGVAIVHNPSPLVRCLGTNVGTLPPIGRIITTF